VKTPYGSFARPRLMAALAAILAALGFLVFSTRSSYADSLPVSGSVGAGGPTFVHPLPGSCTRLSNDHIHYASIGFLTTGTSATTLSVDLQPRGFEAIALLYRGTFDDGDPTANCFAPGVDGTGRLSLRAPVDASTDPTQRWTLIVGDNGPGAPGGTFDATITSSDSRVSRPVTDTLAPVVTVPADLTVEATGAAGRAVSYAATAVDDVDGPLEPTCSSPSGSVFPLGEPTAQPLGQTTVVTCSATDAAGNIGSAQFAVHVRDTTPPVLTLPTAVTAEAQSDSGAHVTYAATAADAVDGSVPPNCAVASGAMFPITSTSVSCAPVDARGNTGNGSFTVTVLDSTPPVLTLPADRSLDATGPDGAAAAFTVSATDAVDGDVPATCTRDSGSTFAVGVTVVSCMATDATGNKATGTFTVTVNDMGAPALTLPDDLHREATGRSGAVVGYTATALDSIDGPITPTCAPASGSTFAVGTTVVHCAATDASNNVARGQFSVTVTDSTGPVLVHPDHVTAEAAGVRGAPVHFDVTATDAVDGSVAVACAPTPGSLFPRGDTEVACTAADTAGNVSSAHFTVSVLDTVGPTLHLPALVTAEATSPEGAPVSYAATATDLGDGDVPVSCQPRPSTEFPLGRSAVSCTAVDADGNRSTGTFAVFVTDTTRPSLTVPSELTVQATGPDGARVQFSSSATDLVDGALAASCNPASGSLFAIGSTTVNCTATDSAGNIAIAEVTVQVVDTAGPVLSLPAAGSIVVGPTGPRGAVVSFHVSATDAVSGVVPVVCQPPSGSLFPIGTTLVTCTAQDAAAPLVSPDPPGILPLGTAHAASTPGTADTVGALQLTLPPNATTATFAVTVRATAVSPPTPPASGQPGTDSGPTSRGGAGARAGSTTGLPNTGAAVTNGLLLGGLFVLGGAFLLRGGRRRTR
jgi:LPXTG-motif cell wall-anchored protein